MSQGQIAPFVCEFLRVCTWFHPCTSVLCCCMHPKTRCTIAPLDWLAIACTWQTQYHSFPLLRAVNVFTPLPPAHPSLSILLGPPIRRHRFFDEWSCKWKEQFLLGCTIVFVRPPTSGEVALIFVLALPSSWSTTFDHASTVLRSYEELLGSVLSP